MLYNCTLHLEKSKKKEKSLLINKWTGNFQSFELINVAIKKNNCGRVFFQSTFTSFRNDSFLEMDSIAVAKICWKLLIFSKHLYCKSMHLWAHCTFCNTINQLHMNGTWSILEVISFGHFIYGGHFMNRQCQASVMQIRKCKNITSKQPLNWIKLIQVRNIQGCFKLYFSLSKLIQSLF